MMDANLGAFVATVLRAKRIRFGDVRRLARVILPRGIADRGTAEALLALDRAIERSDPAWIDYLAGAMSDFVVAGAGKEDDWLAATIGERPTKAGRAIEREVTLGRDLSRHASGTGQGLRTPDAPLRPPAERAGLTEVAG
jgi:hypothetical protein